MKFELGKKLENQEGFLDSDCVGYPMGVLSCVIILISVGKSNADKLDCLFGIIIGTAIITELGKREGFSLY